MAFKFEALYQSVTFGYPTPVAGAGERRDWQPGEVHEDRTARYATLATAKGQATRFVRESLSASVVATETYVDRHGWSCVILKITDGPARYQNYLVRTRVTDLETGERVPSTFTV